jgi:hypothetical protein
MSPCKYIRRIVFKYCGGNDTREHAPFCLVAYVCLGVSQEKEVIWTGGLINGRDWRMATDAEKSHYILGIREAGGGTREWLHPQSR